MKLIATAFAAFTLVASQIAPAAAKTALWTYDSEIASRLTAPLVRFQDELAVMASQKNASSILAELELPTGEKLDVTVTKAIEQNFASVTELVVTGATPDVGGSLNFAGNSASGAIWVDGRQFIFLPVDEKDGTHQISEIKDLDVSHGTPLVPPEEIESKFVVPVKPICNVPLPFPIPVGKGTQVRFLFMWTTKAELGSSSPEADTNVMMRRLATAFQTPNFTIRPVMAHRGTFNLTGTMSSEADLRDITNGKYPTIQQLRNTHRADLVIAITTKEDVCGIAWANQQMGPTSEKYGYSIVRRACGVGDNTGPHEVGHNIGMLHDRTTDAGLKNLGYNFGYIDFTNKRRTIMAYSQPCTDKGFGCRQYSTYSSPKIDVGGSPLGVAIGQANAADNLELLCRHIGTVSKFRHP